MSAIKKFPSTGFPFIVTVWFLVAAPVVTLDAVFVLNRPPSRGLTHPLANISLMRLWVAYAEFDHRYAANDDGFVVAQSWLNFAEAALGLVAVILSVGQHVETALKLALVTSVMTLSKTVLYLLMDVVEGSRYTRHIGFMEKVFVVLLPSSLWIIFPALVTLECSRRLALAGCRTPNISASTRQKKV
ncbi:hypothetical protein TRVL_03581 [Trypanosoma vivax]|uniref:EXPERA domain-containing protein n=1 Tax=Trypanosoma vivax (strain Y486) TaxID=1055687 RepID=G0UA45_TRYVY|nr:hypothetical protein TRVL_03581 [Trypanosoma vivax]CCC52677.1 conserved hypothetical protein [Trypanosoma vivax Y486]